MIVYKMVRCGSGFDPVIMVSPPDAGPNTLEAKYYRCASWQIGDHQPGVFNEISRNMAISYFSGIADGIGFEDPLTDTFPTLDAALQYVTEKKNEWDRKQSEKRHQSDQE